jgi:VWFA-related protein
MPRLSKPPAVWLAALLVAALLCPLAAQEDSGAVFRAETRLVVLHASVVDRNGRLVTDLPQSAFTVYENDVEQKVKIFRREDVPVSLGLIIDNSGSMADKRREVEAAALTLVKNSNPQDEVFIVNFNDEAYLDVDFTSDIKKLQEGLTRIDSRGGTAMRDAISMSIDHLLEKGKRDKKVLLVVTDGNDNTSSTTLEKLIQKAQQSEVLIYAVGLLDKEQRRERKRAERALNALASASGGLAYFPRDTEEVEPICARVAHELRNQYVIAYSPLNQELDGTYRRIKVEVKGRGNPTVRTRSGYYATPDRPASFERPKSTARR